MNIRPINNFVRRVGLFTIATGSILTAYPVTTPKPKSDTFEMTSATTKGTSSTSVLSNAPSPKVKIMGKTQKATIVVDLTQNVLYKYDKKGKPESAYVISSGKSSSPTHEGVRVVSHVETYPYQTAPKTSKRRKHPKDYGPKIICLEVIDTKTGEKSSDGEFIHGTSNPNTLGKHVSHGCVRMDNEVIKELSTQVKRGDIVIFQK
jgi:lipoprotein-anchoring transpeptidase ErfK/SrfK